MSAEIIDLHGHKEEGSVWHDYLDRMKEGNLNIVFVAQSKDNPMNLSIGTSFKDRRDTLVMLYKLQDFLGHMARSLVPFEGMSIIEDASDDDVLEEEDDD